MGQHFLPDDCAAFPARTQRGDSAEGWIMVMAIPYFCDSSFDSPVDIVSDTDGHALVLGVHGRWSSPFAATLRSNIHKCLAEQPPAILVDLTDLGDPDGRSTGLWLAAHRACGLQQPPVKLAICLPAATMLATRLRRNRGLRVLSVFASMPEARAALACGLPLPYQTQLIVQPEPQSASRARDLAAQACLDWRLEAIREATLTVISELVANSVEHAATHIRITLPRRGKGLYLAMHDKDPRLPKLLPCSPHEPGSPTLARGQGLRVVQAVANAWGARRSRSGKLVWATIRDRSW
ncbi:ATP-binding protein [Actinoplanes sp. NPDC051859]|uniref:ATP-binding protein n=1 Tax=Actinoplanes sp. NPDC051859 TaxID=3363909 RepID=UPI0037B26C38